LRYIPFEKKERGNNMFRKSKVPAVQKRMRGILK